MEEIIPFNREEIIEENRKIIQERRKIDSNSLETFAVSQERLDEALVIVNNMSNDLPRREKLVRIASTFMGAMSWAQPFAGANKQTVIFIAMLFLRDNGYDLQIPGYDYEALIDLLYKVQEDRSSPEESALRSLFLYTDNRTVRYEQKTDS